VFHDPISKSAAKVAKVATQGVEPGCDNSCTFGGGAATCEDRMRWAIDHNPQVGMSEDPCEAAGELVKSQCPICDTCSIKKWCEGHKHEKAQSLTTVFMKFEISDIDGLLAHTGLSKFMSASLIMASIVAGVLVWRRQSGAMRASMALTTEDQRTEAYADPLCPSSDEQGSSNSA